VLGHEVAERRGRVRVIARVSVKVGVRVSVRESGGVSEER